MKILKIILLLFLICKSTLGFGLSVFVESTSFCCTEIVNESDINNNEDEEKQNCCGSSSCECLCCSHIFTHSSIEKVKLGFTSHFNILINTEIFAISYSYLFGIWQPPQVSNSI